MINSNLGHIKIEGTRDILLTEFTLLVRGLIEGTEGRITKDDIEYAMKVAFMSDEEREKAIKEKLDNFMESIGVMKDLLDALDKVEDKPDNPDVVATMDANLVRDIFGKE